MSDKGTVTNLSHAEVAAFCSQISMIMHAGIPVAEGLAIMVQDAQNPRDRELLGGIHARVDAGASLHTALQQAGPFPKYVLDMTAIGERSGRLDDVMSSLASYYEREQAIARNIRHAVAYPLIMVAMMVVVFLVLIVKVLPIFQQVFEQLGAEMTGLSRAMMNLGLAIGQYSFALIGLVVLLIAAFFLIRTTAAGRSFYERVRARLFRRLSAKIASERFASAMSMMMKSGLDIEQSLDMADQLVDNELVRAKIAVCRRKMAEGANFSDSLVEADIFSGVHSRMVSVGFKTGSVDVVMERLAATYEDEIDAQISNTIAVLEPTLVALLSIIVGMVLLSVMLPLMGIMSSIS